MMHPGRIRHSRTLAIMQPTNFLFYRVFTKENETSFLRKSYSPFFLQELKPLTPLKATYRFTSLTVIEMTKIMCNNYYNLLCILMKYNYLIKIKHSIITLIPLAYIIHDINNNSRIQRNICKH